ncbi:DUF4381 family protein [Methylobacterium sp. ID0610]|uniref:DUF4381 family protein n=1 Tax=Methylobacterium carpenticola TaxID=3344827 RepID=UPI0036A87E70
MPCCEGAPDPAVRAALADLRGLHPPPETGAVRLDVLAAIGIGLVLAALVLLAHAKWRRQKISVRRAALNELAAARGLDPAARLLAQARLLARLARTLGIEGEDRAAALDRLFATDFFTAGPGRALTRDLYAPASPDPDAIDAGLARCFARIRA